MPWAGTCHTEPGCTHRPYLRGNTGPVSWEARMVRRPPGCTVGPLPWTVPSLQPSLPREVWPCPAVLTGCDSWTRSLNSGQASTGIPAPPPPTGSPTQGDCCAWWLCSRHGPLSTGPQAAAMCSGTPSDTWSSLPIPTSLHSSTLWFYHHFWAADLSGGGAVACSLPLQDLAQVLVQRRCPEAL